MRKIDKHFSISPDLDNKIKISLKKSNLTSSTPSTFAVSGLDIQEVYPDEGFPYLCISNFAL